MGRAQNEQRTDCFLVYLSRADIRSCPCVYALPRTHHPHPHFLSVQCDGQGRQTKEKKRIRLPILIACIFSM